MILNMDFEKLVVVDFEKAQWVHSPGGEVQRLMLERRGEEKGYSTSLVRYPRGSKFPQHVHSGGEEFLVLEGTFSDETGDFPAGSYVRNPIDSEHAPFSEEGCLIFVKLWQMPSSVPERTVKRISNRIPLQDLYSGIPESVFVIKISSGKKMIFSSAEILVLSGSVEFENKQLQRHSWIRIPEKMSLSILAIGDVLIWVKNRNYKLFEKSGT